MTNRLANLVERADPVSPAQTVLGPVGFMACPVALAQGLTAGQSWLYQQVFEMAQAVVRPSLLERAFYPSPN